MTRYNLQILAYQVDFGSIYHDGTESLGTSSFFKKMVPVDKVYVRTASGSEGKWMSQEEEAIFKKKNIETGSALQRRLTRKP